MLKKSDMTLREREMFDVVSVAALKVFLQREHTATEDDIDAAFEAAHMFIEKRREQDV